MRRTRVDDQELSELVAEVVSLYDQASQCEITDDASADTAKAIQLRMAELKKLADGAHRKEKKPFLDGGRKVDAKYKDVREALEEGRVKLEARMEQYLMKVKAAQRAYEEELRAAQQSTMKKAAGAEYSTPAFDLPSKPPPSSPDWARHERPTIVVDDFALLPDEFKQVNQPALNKALREGRTDIPGTRVVQRSRLKAV